MSTAVHIRKCTKEPEETDDTETMKMTLVSSVHRELNLRNAEFLEWEV